MRELVIEANNSCNDECLIKTYCISSDGSGVCSANNLVTAQFKVISVFGKYDNLQLTLESSNVPVYAEKLMKVNIRRGYSRESVFTCHKIADDLAYAQFDADNYAPITSTWSVKDGVVSCTWTLDMHELIWPQRVDMIKDSQQSITLYDESHKVTVARDTSQLPIYHAQYLKCCNRVHGNDGFLLTFDQIEQQIRYRLYYWGHSGKHVTVSLTRKDGIELEFECYQDYGVLGYIRNGTERISVEQQITQTMSLNNNEVCSWATPFVLGDSSISIDASTTVFELKVREGDWTLYTEKDVVLKNSPKL
uniref:Uncharacterized protein n=1 Tax=Tetranychus urticae TaxID=32264 RepID=T1KP79_TETUR